MVEFWMSLAVVLIPYVLGMFTAVSAIFTWLSGNIWALLTTVLLILMMIAFIILTNPLPQF